MLLLSDSKPENPSRIAKDAAIENQILRSDEDESGENMKSPEESGDQKRIANKGSTRLNSTELITAAANEYIEQFTTRRAQSMTKYITAYWTYSTNITEHNKKAKV